MKLDFMKVDIAKKPSKEASKWQEHMAKKAKGAVRGEADITHAKKKVSVAPAKGKVSVQAPKERPQRRRRGLKRRIGLLPKKMRKLQRPKSLLPGHKLRATLQKLAKK